MVLYCNIVTRDVTYTTRIPPPSQSPLQMAVVTRTPAGIKSYYQTKIESAELTINQKTQNLRRLEAQRNALNARGAVYFYF